MTKNNPEILAPAGSLASGIYAFEGGADAVYLGLSDFSARKFATNFTFDHLRRLKKAAVDSEKKIFVAVNTVIREEELDNLFKYLFRLSFFEPDAIIIQDIGMIQIVKKYFPDTSIHASTQMSVHNTEGVKFLQKLGVRRVVLSRELTFNEISVIRNNCPDMELEVFVHGALCYSFSGKCLASGFIAGRSANKGECIQLCRDYYTEDNGSSKFHFSCRDLALYESVRKYADIGIDSLKIEGRMKPPEYSFYASKLYRAILEGADENEIAELKQNLALIFERFTTDSFFVSTSGDDLICNSYASHKGIELGYVDKCTKESFFIKLRHDLSIKDGLMFFEKEGDLDPHKFSVSQIKTVSGREVKWLESGNTAEIVVDVVPEKGALIFQISHRNLDMKNVNELSLPQYFIKTDVEAVITDDSIKLSGKMKNGITAVVEEKIVVEEAKKESDLNAIMQKHLKIADDENLFEVDSVTVINKSRFDKNRIFIPPSQLKSAKRAFVSALSVAFDNKIESFSPPLLSEKEVGSKYDTILSIISDREKINPVTVIEGKESRELPFALNFHLLNIDTLHRFENFVFVPLKPVIKDGDRYIAEFIELVN
ncbi:MAG TPA: peptidase U32 family protein, partial [bacterium]|nr:peptidase U32 family protein [bacterium]